jgi:DNA-binding response OmpR family regulator
MANILITDLFEESAYLVRSLLRGAGHAISISVTREDAEAKLDTGLFDLLVMDYGSVVRDSIEVGKYANELLPGMPVVALTPQDADERLDEIQLAARFHRPIRGRCVKECIQNALNNAYRQSARRAVPRVPLALPVRLELGGVTISSRTVDLSSRGVAIDATDLKLKPDELEAIENVVGRTGAKAALTVAEGTVIELSARLAFVERHRSLSGRTIGLAFERLDEETEVALSSLYNKAA